MSARQAAMRHARACGQGLTEQVLLIAAVAAALIGLQLYLRLAIQGRMHASRASLLGRETPVYEDGAVRIREYHYNATETITAAPARVILHDPLRPVLSENRVLTEFTATTAFNETTVTR